MSELKKPTIEGLIEKLLEEKHIQENEAGTVQALLGQASNGLNKEEIFTLVTKLNDKLDAHTSDLITPNGLNYSVFESEVKTVTQVIKKVQREKSQAQATVEPLQEKKDIEKTPQEKAEIERQQRIADNKRYIGDLFKRLPELAQINLSEEDIDEISEEIENQKQLYKLKEEFIKQGDSPEVADQKIDKIAGKNTDDAISYAAAATIVYREAEERNKNGQNDWENFSHESQCALKKLKENKEIGQMIEDGEKKGSSPTDILSAVLKLTWSLVKERQNNKDINSQRTVEANEGMIRAVIYDKNGANVRSLIGYIDNLEKAKKAKNDEGLSEEDKADKEKLFEFFTERYLAMDSTVSMSILYERYKNLPRVKRFEIEFEDFLKGIEDNLRKHANIVGDEAYIKAMMDAERTLRKSILLNQVIDAAQNEGNELLEKDDLEKFNKDVEKARSEAQEGKNKFATRRNIDVKKHRENHERIMRKKSSAPKLEFDIVRIEKDREQIIKMSKDLGISTDDAAKEYFSSHPEKFFLYTRREQKILLGKNKINKELNLQTRKTLKKLSTFMKEKNDMLISTYTHKIEELTKKIQEGDYTPQKFESEWRRLEKAKTDLERAQSRNKKIDKMPNFKSAMVVFEKREKKEFEKNMFVNYLKSGKSAYEFFEGMKKDGKESPISKNELIDIIGNGSRKYLIPNELGIFIENEKTIFYNENLLEKLKLKRACAEKQGLTAWCESCDKKIKELEKNIEECKRMVAESRKSIQKRMGLNPNEIGRTEGTTQTKETAQIPDSGESKTSNAIDLNQTQEEQGRGSKNGLAVEEIEVIGVKPNVKAIAKKKKVTPKRIKEAFSKIVGLKKSKQEIVEQTEQEVNPDEKTTQTNIEGIR